MARNQEKTDSPSANSFLAGVFTVIVRWVGHSLKDDPFGRENETIALQHSIESFSDPSAANSGHTGPHSRIQKAQTLLGTLTSPLLVRRQQVISC